MARTPRDFFGRRKEGYYQATHRPLNCLVFLLPLIILYEWGSYTAGPLPLDEASAPGRVIAFYWIVRFLGLFATVPTYVPGVLLVIVLVLWHLVTEGRTRLRWQVLGGMAVETFLFCIPLLVLNLMLQAYVLAGTTGSGPLLAGSAASMRDQLVIAMTAGIFEELIFRLLLIWMFKLFFVDLLKWPKSESLAGIVVITAVLFGGYHYLGQEQFLWRTFLFRSAAGVFLGMIYVLRGFGITVGTHSLYDVVVTLWAA